MPATCVVGMQWGDEGKGKIVDLLSEGCDIVVRYQGGSNAGHRVVIDGQTYAMHQVPTGILRPGVQCVLASGMVIDPEELYQEVQALTERGVEVAGRLWVSDRAHVVMPYHKVLDRLREEARGERKIGTTARGIGPCYADKFNRTGLRIADLVRPRDPAERIRAAAEEKNREIVHLHGGEPLEVEPMVERFRHLADWLRPLVRDTAWMLNEALDAGGLTESWAKGQAFFAGHLFFDGVKSGFCNYSLLILGQRGGHNFHCPCCRHCVCTGSACQGHQPGSGPQGGSGGHGGRTGFVA